jgi:UDP-N-acetylmuramyl pentapeptide phosphotransferase/UDP-N-acetylglucosamine-1-phosphate transferase
VGLPVGTTLFFIAWVVLTKVVFRGIDVAIPSGIQKRWLEQCASEIEAWGTPHTRGMLIFASVVLGWILFTQDFAEDDFPTQSATVHGMCAVILLLIIPTGSDGDPPGAPLLFWEDASRSI